MLCTSHFENLQLIFDNFLLWNQNKTEFKTKTQGATQIKLHMFDTLILKQQCICATLPLPDVISVNTRLDITNISHSLFNFKEFGIIYRWRVQNATNKNITNSFDFCSAWTSEHKLPSLKIKSGRDWRKERDISTHRKQRKLYHKQYKVMEKTSKQKPTRNHNRFSRPHHIKQCE